MSVNPCRDFMRGSCKRDACKFAHDTSICPRWWKNASCKYGNNCKKKHIITQVQKGSEQKHNRSKNTECFVPMSKPVDMRVILELSHDKFSRKFKERDVILAPNVFSDFEQGELYRRLVKEVEECSDSDTTQTPVLKLWHGNEKIEGTHLIANDRTGWKSECPTFQMVVDRISKYFQMNVKATRFNWYKDTSHWKPFHFDSAKVDPEKAKVQNFTVAVSFGATREAAFERDDENKNVISFPVGDGQAYCFAKETNCIWRHGILHETPVREEGRISVICWGWVKATN